jgi:putative ABC transport system substrate-binding protein
MIEARSHASVLPCRYLAVLLLVTMALTVAAAASQKGSVIVLYDEASEVHREFMQGFAGAIADPGAYAQVAVDDKGDVSAALAELQAGDLVVTVGSRIFQQVAEAVAETDVLAAFLPRAAFQHVTESVSTARRERMSAVFLDQPPEKQLILARELLTGISAVGVVISDELAASAQQLAQAASENGLVVRVETIHDGSEVSQAFARILRDVDVTVAVPDPLLLNRNNTKWFLYMAFQRKVPVIGFSEAFVKAGALAAVFSTPGQVGQQAAERVGQWEQGGWNAIADAIASRYLKVATNETIARGLGLTLPSADALEQRLHNF